MSSTAEIRQTFLDFFSEKQHSVVRSSALVPAGDDTLLFTNAGMVQFKDVFLGKETRNYSRATSSQRCVRAGGKHNDLENVGYTARHHTFFEMLGNFSFGDYFKQEAIEYAWEFLTQVLNLPPEKLWITVYEEDDEAADIWLNKIGVDSTRFSKIGAKDNFWQMGDTGPCGPCTEIFYDHGSNIPGGPPGTPEEDGDRYIEIWNLVFMQYNRSADGTLTDLPKPSVDTGMGLERLAAILQGVHSNYEIDLFVQLIDAAKKATKVKNQSNSLKVIADHIRSCAFLIADGVLPSNEGRGYVLRRIIRRACRHGHKLGQTAPFFYTLVNDLVEIMGSAYPELIDHQEKIEHALLKEEQRFAETLSQGMGILQEAMQTSDKKILSGEVIFQLYDTYGFPVDLTADIAREHSFELDMPGYEHCMEAQRTRARLASQFGKNNLADIQLNEQSTFIGYESLDGQSSIICIIKDNALCNSLNQGDKASIVLLETPFYAESGGQIGDCGRLYIDEKFDFIVKDTQKSQNAIVHTGVVTLGSINIGDIVSVDVDEETRKSTERNHSATHLLHWALRDVLGAHVQQKGSLVTNEYLRFDFSHDAAVTHDEIIAIENLVNQEIRKNISTTTRVMDIESAKNAGALALFGEKYDDSVRVLNIGEHSVELCGGTHVSRTGDIGFFKIISESSVASGVRRLEAITGQAAEHWVQKTEQNIHAVNQILKTDQDGAAQKVQTLLDKNRSLEKELEQLKIKLANNTGSDLASDVTKIAGISVIAKQLENADIKTLRSTLDGLKDKLGQAAIVLASVEDGTIRLIAGVTKQETQLIKAGNLVNHVAAQVGGKGGGRPDMAQAGGNQPENLAKALSSVPDWIEQQLS